MTKVNIRVPLLRDDNPIGFIFLGYDDESGISASLPNRQREVDIFFLEELMLQIDVGGINEIDDFVDGFDVLDLSPQLNNAALAYFPLPRNRRNSFGATRRVDEEFFNFWVIQATENTDFLTSGSAWGIAPLGSSAMADAEVSGSLGEVEIIPASEMPTIPTGTSSVPRQAAPVNRRTIFDPNFNPEPSFAIEADPNDPMRFLIPIRCGCHILSDISRVMCLRRCVF